MQVSTSNWFSHNNWTCEKGLTWNICSGNSYIGIKEPTSPGNKLGSLSPFLDNYGTMWAGGRLGNASISYDQKHPFILHKKNILTQLIVQHYHTKYLHAGNRQLHYLLGSKYWIPGVSQVIKRTIYQCTTCMRFRQSSFQQRMGDLPSCRLQPSSTFLYIGIDITLRTIVERAWLRNI